MFSKEEISIRGCEEVWSKSPERDPNDSDLYSDPELMEIERSKDKKKKKKKKKKKSKKSKKSKKKKKKNSSSSSSDSEGLGEEEELRSIWITDVSKGRRFLFVAVKRCGVSLQRGILMTVIYTVTPN